MGEFNEGARGAPGRQERADTVLGIAITVIFLAVFWVSTQMPTTPLHDPMRDVFRQWHFNLGLLLTVLLAIRLWRWRTRPQPLPSPGLPEAAFALWRTLIFVFFLSLFLMGLVGIGHLWANGFDVRLLGVVTLPSPIEHTNALWQFFGYAHSIFGFYYIMLLGVMILIGLWQTLRYRASVLRLVPGPVV